MGGTQRDAGHGLHRLFHAAAMPNMAFIFVRELPQGIQHRIGRHHAYGAVRRLGDHGA